MFDFDHTLVDGNTDTWVTKMYPPTKQLIRKHQQNGWCWTNIMSNVFSVLSSSNFKQKDYERCLETLQLTPGMQETCNFLRVAGVQSIIISDSNSYFIDHLLQRESLHDVFSNIYTNPAKWDDNGCLLVERYQDNRTCNLCPKNLCKNEVLQTYLRDHNQSYDVFVYTGDGHGDLCPSVALNKEDFILAREGYKLLNCLQGEKKSEVKARVIPWVSGFDVLEFFKELFAN